MTETGRNETCDFNSLHDLLRIAGWGHLRHKEIYDMIQI